MICCFVSFCFHGFLYTQRCSSDIYYDLEWIIFSLYMSVCHFNYNQYFKAHCSEDSPALDQFGRIHKVTCITKSTLVLSWRINTFTVLALQTLFRIDKLIFHPSAVKTLKLIIRNQPINNCCKDSITRRRAVYMSFIFVSAQPQTSHARQKRC